jgi:hypothetical protein
MDKSYRMKMEKDLQSNTLKIEYVLNCIAKHENKINQLAYKERRYRNAYSNNYKIQMDELIAYRKPFIDLLMQDCHMSLDDIKESVSKVKEKNIPTQKVCDDIRNMIISGCYWIE